MDLFGDKLVKLEPPASLSASASDENLYQKAQPHFESVHSNFEGVDDRTAIRELLKFLKENHG